jgi:FkbM family methyltransferase
VSGAVAPIGTGKRRSGRPMHVMSTIRRIPASLERWRTQARERLSYAQCGEDRIAHFVLSWLGVPAPTYLDIGAHGPTRFSNTYLFYRAGNTGVCVEPNPALRDAFRRKRPKDVYLGVGIGPEERKGVPFYVMRSDTLSTFSKARADRLVAECGEQVVAVLELDIVTPNRVMEEHFESGPDFVSLDIEGREVEVLGAIDFTRFRPKVFCVETVRYAIDGTDRKTTGAAECLRERGYIVYADTYINTIFVDEAKWKRRGEK